MSDGGSWGSLGTRGRAAGHWKDNPPPAHPKPLPTALAGRCGPTPRSAQKRRVQKHEAPLSALLAKPPASREAPGTKSHPTGPLWGGLFPTRRSRSSSHKP